MAKTSIEIVQGTAADIPTVLGLFDTAVEWLKSQDRTGQWGTKPFSQLPRRVKTVTEAAASSHLWLAVDFDSETTPDVEQPFIGPDGRRGVVVGSLEVGDKASYVESVPESELYVKFLVTDRKCAGNGVGGLLLDQARKLAREAGVELLRLDCYAGGDGKLIRYYEKQGFVRTTAFEHEGWPGQLLVERMSNSDE
ncbi:putative GNAT family acetyltransferase [Aspergillus clavatus NRRL 1]|uniref:GNAT family acetyltransferase, putative n=1 Tax=Aspergillus clavatus (strain ATCC 1007 / CBS 513.65 / DSM 816 / NCTC 3887 / NRRL 1 / QM 1276 / 107) TaxID=344612 RepID=A1C871_ASPCL|nr:GNAT family acetyltransferase, putative [Aspergillus clavatus NRRL 1]EAW14592.1 GNAT family acetyltransferase, putative [Aspergillus clavatus NRRL 1]